VKGQKRTLVTPAVNLWKKSRWFYGQRLLFLTVIENEGTSPVWTYITNSFIGGNFTGIEERPLFHAIYLSKR